MAARQRRISDLQTNAPEVDLTDHILLLALTEGLRALALYVKGLAIPVQTRAKMPV